MLNKFAFQGKYIIEADLRCLTGLHIGGTAEGLEIGGIDNPIIKDPISALPYLPGSSLKGKLRSLSEWVVEHTDKKGIKQTRVEYMQSKGNGKAEPCDCGECDVCVVFGSSAEVPGAGPTRLTVRDAFPANGTIKEWEESLGEGIHTELKTENVINRITSEANPRTMERVPKDSVFKVEMVYDIYSKDDKEKLKTIFQAMRLLENSSLGGSGSRGYGKVIFDNIVIKKRSKEYYTEGRKEEIIEEVSIDTVVKEKTN